MGKSVDFKMPVGRLVQGSCFEGSDTNMDGEKRVDANGQPKFTWFIAVAYPKNDPTIMADFLPWKAQLESMARTAFPQLFPGGAACIRADFAWKIIDGDGIDTNGKPWNTREGFAGHWVVKFGSNYPIKNYEFGKFGPMDQLADPKSIPRGHYVMVAGSMNDNIPSKKPGMYVNVNMVARVRGEMSDIITSGPDAATVFGGASGVVAYAAAGATMLPAANGISYESYKAQGWNDAQLIAAGYMSPPMIAPAAPPAPQAAPMPPKPPVTPHTAILTGPQMTAAAQFSYAEYAKQGWNDAQLIAAGFMLAPVAAVPVPPPAPSAGSAPPPPSAQTAVAPPPPASGKVLLPAAGATTYQQYIDAGWSDAQLVQNGFMAA